MPCNYPVRAYRLQSGEVVFETKKGYNIIRNIKVACGQCQGCRQERARQWSIRCMHEAALHEENCFITLTYDDDHIPDLGSLNYEHFQLFMKRLRDEIYPQKIRYYMCGEYGEKGDRPHYHACIFGYDFKDKKIFKEGENRLFTSETLEKLWPFGFCTIGAVTSTSAAYVASYIHKKAIGRNEDWQYEVLDKETGEVYYKEKEFNHMSLKPGIGSGWYDKYKKEVYPFDRVIVKGKAIKPPRYYTKKYAEQDPEGYEELCYQREIKSMSKSEDNTDERLLVKEECLIDKIKRKERRLK